MGGHVVVGLDDEHRVAGHGAEQLQERPDRPLGLGVPALLAAGRERHPGQARVGGEGDDVVGKRLVVEAALVEDVGDGGGV
ncbi:MAG TPA: hypothetical protein VGX21_09410, partial [Methylomirabilota bacterium]|nr:hypothetical protein [Methylomirabilota bacterium]